MWSPARQVRHVARPAAAFWLAVAMVAALHTSAGASEAAVPEELLPLPAARLAAAAEALASGRGEAAPESAKRIGERPSARRGGNGRAQTAYRRLQEHGERHGHSHGGHAHHSEHGEHHGHSALGHAQHHFTVVDEAISAMLCGTISFVMMTFYLVKYPDVDIQRYAWSIISMTVSIFTSVLVFEGFWAVIDNRAFRGHGDITRAVAVYSVFFVAFLALEGFLMWLMDVIAVPDSIYRGCRGCLERLGVKDKPEAEEEELGPCMACGSVGRGCSMCRGRHARRIRVELPQSAILAANLAAARRNSLGQALSPRDASRDEDEEEEEVRLHRARCWGTLGGHMLSFLSIHAGGCLQQMEMSRHSPNRVLAAVLVHFIMMQFLFLLLELFRLVVYRNIGDSLPPERWTNTKIRVREVEDEVAVLSYSFLVVQALRFSLTEVLPSDTGLVEYTRSDYRWARGGTGLTACAVFFLVAAQFLTVLGKRLLLRGKIAAGSRAEDTLNRVQATCIMAFAWCTFFGSKIFLFVTVTHTIGWHPNHIKARVLLALTFSTGCFSMVFALDKIDDLCNPERALDRLFDSGESSDTSEGDMSDVDGQGDLAEADGSVAEDSPKRQQRGYAKLAQDVKDASTDLAQKVADRLQAQGVSKQDVSRNICRVIEALGFLVGFAWEHSFEGAAECLACQGAAPQEAKLALGVAISAIVVPQWSTYIMSTVAVVEYNDGRHPWKRTLKVMPSQLARYSMVKADMKRRDRRPANGEFSTPTKDLAPRSDLSRAMSTDSDRPQKRSPPQVPPLDLEGRCISR